MRTDTALKPTLLRDYAPYPFNIDSVHLLFRLAPEETEVRSRLIVRREHPGDLRLDGDGVRLVSVAVDGRELARSEFTLDQKALTLTDVPDVCEVEIVSTCRPSDNTTLMGLYVSGGSMIWTGSWSLRCGTSISGRWRTRGSTSSTARS